MAKDSPAQKKTAQDLDAPKGKFVNMHSNPGFPD